MAPIRYSESIGYNAEFLQICSCELLYLMYGLHQIW